MAEEPPITMGVDLGTTYSCVAIMESHGPRVLTHDYDKRIFPSTFSIEDRIWHVGKHDTTEDPGDVQFIHNVKRVLGRNSRDGRLEADIKTWDLPFELDDEGDPFCQVGDEQVRPVEFVALLLLRAQKIVKDATGKSATSCVITVPAYFSDAQRRATRDAAQIAGVDVLRLLNEPTAVAVAHLWDSERTGRFFVVDAGGGTIDCSKLHLSTSQGKKTFVVEATSGDNALGGHDFLYTLAELFEKKANDVPRDELVALCEGAKRQRDDPIHIQARGQRYTISQTQYKRALSKYFGKVQQVIKEALGGGALDGVILAGGASRQPQFEELIKEELKDNEFLPQRPAAEVVAEGAAIMADTSNDIVVTDVLSRSLGIDTQRKDKQRDDIMEVVLKRNTSLPTSHTKCFTSVSEKKTGVHLYEGEHSRSSENNSLGEFYIDVAAGEAIKVTITASDDAEIEVQAVTAQGSKELTVKRKESELTDSELETMRQNAQRRFASAEVDSSRAKQPPRKKRRRRRR